MSDRKKTGEAKRKYVKPCLSKIQVKLDESILVACKGVGHSGSRSPCESCGTPGS